MIRASLLFAVASSVVSVAIAQSPGSFIATGNLTSARFGHTATLLADGRVLIAGGYTDRWDPLPFPPSGHAITATAELYDPATGTFTPTGSMTVPRSYHTATLLPDGRVLIAAGRGEGRSEDNLASAELYDPSTGTFTAAADIPTPSSNDINTATLLPDGRVFITGATSRAELYDPATDAFTGTSNTTVSLGFNTATLLPDGRVLLGGYLGARIYDFRADTISLLDGNDFGATGRAALLVDGQVLIAGGNDDPGPSDVAELYDPSTGTFALTAKMTAPRANHTATLLPDGKALLAGGSGWVPTTFSGLQGVSLFCCLPGTELYDPSTGAFAATGSMAAGRAGHTATLLNSGMVLIAGGGGGSNSPALATAELYIPDVLSPAPVLFSGAIQHADTYQPVTADNPAVAGEIILISCTGLNDGAVTPTQVAIGGRMAELVSFGKGAAADLNQVNVRIPSGMATGPAVPVRLTYLGRHSNEVTIGVQ